jgi:hypothetical protein
MNPVYISYKIFDTKDNVASFYSVRTPLTHRTKRVFDRYNIVSKDDLKEAASMHQMFNKKMAERW